LSETEKDLHAAAHGLYTLQSFTIKSYSAHREWLYDEIFVHKNLRVIAPFLLVYPAAGLALKMLKSGAFGGLHRAGEKLTGKKHTHDRLDDVLTELEDAKTHPWVGGLRLYVDGLATQMGMESTKRWSEIALLLEMGGKKHKKEAFGKMKYAAMDELEQKIGGIYSDLWNALAGQVYAGYKYGTTQHAKPKRRAAEAVEGKIVEQLAPGTKLIPWIDKIAHPPKR